MAEKDAVVRKAVKEDCEQILGLIRVSCTVYR